MFGLAVPWTADLQVVTNHCSVQPLISGYDSARVVGKKV